MIALSAQNSAIRRPAGLRFGAKNDVGLGNGTNWTASSFLVTSGEVSTGFALNRGRYLGSLAHALEFWGPKQPDSGAPLPGAVRGIHILKTIANLEAKDGGMEDWQAVRKKTLELYDQEKAQFKAQKLRTRFWQAIKGKSPQEPSYVPAKQLHFRVKLADILGQYSPQEQPNVQRALELMDRNTYLLNRTQDEKTGEDHITLRNSAYDILIDQRDGVF